MTQYLEVNFDNLSEELASCLPPESPSVLRQQESASHLRQVIRLLMAERSRDGDMESASELVERLETLSAAEKALLRRRMSDLAERAQASKRPPLGPEVLRAVNVAAGSTGIVTGITTGAATAGSPPPPPESTLPLGGRRVVAERAVLGGAGVGSVLRALTNKAVELLQADICQVFLVDRDLLVLQAEAPDRAGVRGADRAGIRGPDRIDPEAGFAGTVRAAGRAWSVPSGELTEGPERTWAERGALHIAAVPVGSPGEDGVGLLVALRVTHRPFSGEDLVQMSQLADEVTLAMASADLLARAEELAVLKERMTLAREIHDGLASDLSAVVQMFKYHEHRRRVDPADADLLLVQMRELVEGALQSARDILSALRPRQQTPRRLAETLKQQVEAFSRTYGVSGVTRIVGDDSGLVAEEREAIFQVVRESLTNIRKHSECSTVEVVLDMTQRPFVLVVEDDGVGIDLGAAEEKAGSFGILGMRERAQLLGGTLDIANGAAGGVRLEFHGPAVPLGA